MAHAIGPISIWEILDRSVRLYRRHVWKLFGAALLVGLAAYGINRLFLLALLAYVDEVQAGGASAAKVVTLVGMTFVTFAVAILLILVRTGIMALLASDAYVADRVSVGRTLRTFPYRAVVFASLLAAVVTTAGLLLLLVPGLFMLITFALVPVVSAVERRRPLEALKRSWALVRAPMPKGFWNNNVTRVVVIWVFASILQLLVLGADVAVAGAAPDSWRVDKAAVSIRRWEFKPLRPAAQVVSDMLTRAVAAFITPFGMCALVILYYDTRVRREGFDIERMLDVEGHQQRARPNWQSAGAR